MHNAKQISWVLVTGASSDISPDEVEVSKQIGAMLAREGYGLIVGDWERGVNRLMKAIDEVVLK